MSQETFRNNVNVKKGIMILENKNALFVIISVKLVQEMPFLVRIVLIKIGM